MLNLNQEQVFDAQGRNKHSIVGIIETMYDSIRPFLVWGDYETSSEGRSYQELIAGEQMCNNLMIVGTTLLPRLRQGVLDRYVGRVHELPGGAFRKVASTVGRRTDFQ